MKPSFHPTTNTDRAPVAPSRRAAHSCSIFGSRFGMSALLAASVGIAAVAAWGCGSGAAPKATETPAADTGATPAADTGETSAAQTEGTPAGEAGQTPPAATTETSAPAEDATLSDADAKALVEKRCVGCHKIDKVDEKKADAAGWEKIVTSMEKHGLKITATERKQIIDYLARR